MVFDIPTDLRVGAVSHTSRGLAVLVSRSPPIHHVICKLPCGDIHSSNMPTRKRSLKEMERMAVGSNSILSLFAPAYVM